MKGIGTRPIAILETVESTTALRLFRQRTAVVILSGHDDASYVRAAAAEGVAGYVLKDEANDTVLEAVRTAAAGALWFSSPILAKLLTEARVETDAFDSVALNARDRIVLDGLAHGWDNARIAAALGLAEQTIRNHLSRLASRRAPQQSSGPKTTVSVSPRRNTEYIGTWEVSTLVLDIEYACAHASSALWFIVTVEKITPPIERNCTEVPLLKSFR